MRCLVVDGYNIIGDWEELKYLAAIDLSAARHNLYEDLLNYCGYIGCDLILVYDAYNTDEGERIYKHGKSTNHRVVYTKKGQTADQYIEKFVRKNTGEIVVASSDALIQIMIFAYASRMSARELKEEVDISNTEIRNRQKNNSNTLNTGLWMHLDESIKSKLDQIRKGEYEEKISRSKTNTSHDVAMAKKYSNPKSDKMRNSEKNKTRNIVNNKTALSDSEKENENTKHEPRKKRKRKSSRRHGSDRKIQNRSKRDNRENIR